MGTHRFDINLVLGCAHGDIGEPPVTGESRWQRQSAGVAAQVAGGRQDPLAGSRSGPGSLRMAH